MFRLILRAHYRLLLVDARNALGIISFLLFQVLNKDNWCCEPNGTHLDGCSYKSRDINRIKQSLLNVINNNQFESCFELKTFNNSSKKSQRDFVARQCSTTHCESS